MAPSFTYPQQLLHKTTEPQWFPRPKEENESSLDALEAAEEAHLEFLRKIAQKEAPDPIGVAAAAPSAAAAAANNSTNTSQPPQPPQPPPYVAPPDPAAAADLSYTGRTTRFWNQPRTPAPAAEAAVPETAVPETPAATRRMESPVFS